MPSGHGPFERGVQDDVLVGDVERTRLASAQGVLGGGQGGLGARSEYHDWSNAARPTTVPAGPYGAMTPAMPAANSLASPRAHRGWWCHGHHHPARGPARRPAPALRRLGGGLHRGRAARLRAGPLCALGRRAAGDDPQHLTAPGRVGRGRRLGRRRRCGGAGDAAARQPDPGGRRRDRAPRPPPTGSRHRPPGPRRGGRPRARPLGLPRRDPVAGGRTGRVRRGLRRPTRVCRRADRAAQRPVPARGPCSRWRPP